MIRLARVAVLLGFLLLPAMVGEAGGDEGCTFDMTPLRFGIYRRSGAASTATLRVRCQPDVSYSIAISAGPGGGFHPRRLIGPRGEYRFNLYTSRARDEIWGDGSSGTSVRHGVGEMSFTVYGWVPGNQERTAGEYEAPLVVTLMF